LKTTPHQAHGAPPRSWGLTFNATRWRASARRALTNAVATVEDETLHQVFEKALVRSAELLHLINYAGLTRAHAAELLGTDTDHLRRILKCEARPWYGQVNRLREALGLPRKEETLEDE
jgi:hypothetical protein